MFTNEIEKSKLLYPRRNCHFKRYSSFKGNPFETNSKLDPVAPDILQNIEQKYFTRKNVC